MARRIARLEDWFEFMTAPLIELNRVTVMRGERAALEEVSLRIEAGEHVCILGPNGCGKSTLIKTITRECYPLAREGSSMAILGRERWDVFELAEFAGDCIAGFAGGLHDGCDGTGRGAERIFQQHEDFPASPARPGAFAEERRGAGAVGNFALSRPMRDAHVERGSEADADCAGPGA